MPKKHRVCDCGSHNITRSGKIGWDIWPGGEEDQYIETCHDCKSERFVSIVYEDEGPHKFTNYGKWSEPKNR